MARLTRSSPAPSSNQRLVYSRGLIGRSANDLQLSAIEEVRLVQDFFGRIFNSGLDHAKVFALSQMRLENVVWIKPRVQML